jgi:DNA-binding transcriptional ArsR family regulator
MTVKQIPDYELDEMIVVTAPGQLRALADPLRSTLLDLLHERAATVTEMALAVDRPKSTIAYHVNLLVDSGLLRVVRTRRVRAMEERYYGRIARTIYVGALHRDEDKQIVSAMNGLVRAAAKAMPAHAADDLRCTLVHARIPREEVRNFWAAVQDLARQFAQIPRAGDQVYGFVAGLYPTDAPALPGPAEVSADLCPANLGGGPQLAVGRRAQRRSVEHRRSLRALAARWRAGGWAASVRLVAKAGDDPLQQAVVMRRRQCVVVDAHQLGGDEILQQHARHAERERAVRGELRDRLGAGGGAFVQPSRLRRQPGRGARVVPVDRDERVHVGVIPGSGAAAGEHVGPDPRVSDHRRLHRPRGC